MNPNQENPSNDEVFAILPITRGRYQSKFRFRCLPKTRKPRSVQYGNPWESTFMRKSISEKRDIMQKPWELPMAAQHLSAIMIQKQVRGMLTRMKLRKWRNTSKDSKSIVCFQSPIQRFIVNGGVYEDEEGFRHFVATYIQAWYKKECLRWEYTVQRFPLYHIAAVQIQYAWKAYYQRKFFKYHGMSPQVQAALRIQLLWKSYTNKRIYRFYRDLISFRDAGDPAVMLRAINPLEASLLDGCVGGYARFRLGGMSFPPTIYYKIFTRKAVCDINAFSPKDYTLARAVCKSVTKTKMQVGLRARFIRVGSSYHRANQTEEETQSWYRRIESNGWRPVTSKVISEANNDPIAQSTGKKATSFHYCKINRHHDVERQRKLKKTIWMKKLYTQRLLKEKPGMEKSEVDFDTEDWEAEADAMFEWASSLDFDNYFENWHDLGKTVSSDAKMEYD